MRHSMWNRLSALCLALCLLAAGLPLTASAASTSPVYESTILFTHDTHDHFLPMPDEEGGEYGGYTRLATLLKQEREAHPDALTLDAGDFSMGSLFQTIYATHAPELQALGAMGYDVTTLGNHEFDYRAQGLADMLNAAVDSGSPLPAIVQANYKPPESDTASWEAWERYGIQDYIILERGGISYGIFGLMGEEADSNAPMSGMEFEPTVEAAQRTVAAIQAELEQSSNPSLIICLSHSGTDGKGKGEDYELAKAVDGIDLIISGHTHTVLEEPLQVGDTLIVSAGEYTSYLGSLTLSWSEDGQKAIQDYRLIPVDETVAADPGMEQLTNRFQPLMESEYLAQYGLKFDQVLATTEFAFTPISQFAAEQREDTLGNLIADSYIYAVQQAEGENYVPVDFAVVASGVIRGSFAAGEITTSDAFNVSSLGSGADGTPGYPLISVWITGKELEDAFEVDASVTPIMSAAQLYGSGMTWTWNPHRIIFNKVNSCAQVLPDGTTVPLENDKLYRVVTGLYSGQMLGTVNSQSFGILTITPKDANGNVITNFEDHIIYNPDGSEVKEWYALASYLQSMGTVDARYSAPEGRKVEERSWNPISLLKGLNLIGGIALAVLLVVILLVVLLIYRIVTRKRRRGSWRSGYRPYRG
ncbi:bifunctional metallophosphatase/5'-nucleotidase [Pseudoflavonifractor phocaeensis]|uniref:bifunctional metallophosphatase/5'-nucleotidase n=1 Tax=Pseudoflavonifractor phocaeensis TaxID=1870988 RepID=UPI00195A3A6B|nr:bifunctional UDP-sugar hydrolase/5'-nucleotidase [Pseudoflavonifractor phocaeensis]MBM6885819.1 bifunctional metallophosphatase/5'-nucleotidase [Pseudoflavonifractor phocaeensis]